MVARIMTTLFTILGVLVLCAVAAVGLSQLRDQANHRDKKLTL